MAERLQTVRFSFTTLFTISLSTIANPTSNVVFTIRNARLYNTVFLVTFSASPD
ncbi:MAG: hypothetical protein ACLTML_09065 [Blautia faecis]